MTYTVAVVAGVLGALSLDLLVLRTRLVAGRTFWLTYPIILAFQLASNGVLTARRIVTYDPSTIIGVRVIHAPIEDLAFGFALVLSSLASWVWLGRRQERERSGA
jgi:lycopene cyclase domain-containing protein